MPIHFTDEKTGQPVKDLQRYLGAFGREVYVVLCRGVTPGTAWGASAARGRRARGDEMARR